MHPNAFLLMDDVVFHELSIGSPMTIDHSLTHSILINLFIKVELNIFSRTFPAKYCVCPKHFMLKC